MLDEAIEMVTPRSVALYSSRSSHTAFNDIVSCLTSAQQSRFNTSGVNDEMAGTVGGVPSLLDPSGGGKG
jgi:hypothetical protein